MNTKLVADARWAIGANAEQAGAENMRSDTTVIGVTRRWATSAQWNTNTCRCVRQRDYLSTKSGQFHSNKDA